MVKKEKIVNFLNKYLKVDEYKDYAANGLQVDGKDDVKKIGFAVDACLLSINEAKNAGCDMLIVHHGMFWDKIGPITNQMYHRIKTHIDSGISLYACHAPLDIHPIVGNNAELLKMFGLRPSIPFGSDKHNTWGYMDTLKKPITIKKAKEILSALESDMKVYNFGKKQVKSIACVSGGAGFSIPEAVEKEIDLLVIGEIKHSSYHIIKEGKINVIAPGHYATETLGVKALMSLIRKKFRLKTLFFDIPTGL
jgi:dinuclear metal center YbgI/SA1388 family protein